jgi:hypothetical protein
MWVTLVAMTLSNSMILVDQTAVPLATPDAIRDLGGCWPADLPHLAVRAVDVGEGVL